MTFRAGCNPLVWRDVVPPRHLLQAPGGLLALLTLHRLELLRGLHLQVHWRYGLVRGWRHREMLYEVESLIPRFSLLYLISTLREVLIRQLDIVMYNFNEKTILECALRVLRATFKRIVPVNFLYPLHLGLRKS